MVSLCLVTTSCKNSTQQTEPEVVSTNVKSELTSSSSETSSTLNTILSSNLYSVIQASETSSPNLVVIHKAPRLETTATTSPFNPDSMVISLSTITGTYEFCKKDSIPFKGLELAYPQASWPIHFKKTANTPADAFVLNYNSYRLKHTQYILADTLKSTVNDHSIKVSDLFISIYKQGTPNEQDSLRLTSSISVNGNLAGTHTSRFGVKGKVPRYALSQYTLPNGVILKAEAVSKDTVGSVTYTLINSSNKTVFSEQFIGKKTNINDTNAVERYYALTFGKVKLARITNSNKTQSFKVYLNGVEQTKATVSFSVTKTVSVTNSEASTNEFDITIKFDDNSTASLSSLAGTNTLPKLRKIFTDIFKNKFGTDFVLNCALEVWKENTFGVRPEIK